MSKNKILKENDLMVGNIVYYSKLNKKYTKVKEIKCTHDNAPSLYYIKGQRMDNDELKTEFDETFVCDILHPIPCTTEFFEKNGFERFEKPDSEYGEEMFSLEVCNEDEYYDIVVTWRDSFDNGVYGENHEHWDECWTINATCGTRTYNSENEDVIYVHELQQICHILGINKIFIV